MGRLRGPEYHSDWAVDWGLRNGRVAFRWVIVDHSDSLPYCVITEIEFIGDKGATKRYKMFEAKGLEWVHRAAVVNGLLISVIENELGRLLLTDGFPKTTVLELRDHGSAGVNYQVRVTARRAGTDTGKDVLVHWRSHLERIHEWILRRNRPLTREELAWWKALI
jgi:hypothetical protein